MKIVINSCYGGYGISDEAMELLHNTKNWDNCDEERTSEDLISLIEEKGSEFVSDECANLIVVEIPDEATDWYIDDYDGMENVIYVLDGKICFA